MANDLQSTLKAGIESARKGDNVRARELLQRVVDMDERNELAWLWLATTTDNIGQRRRYLEKVLDINPNNQRAIDALQRLNAGTPSSEGRSRSAVEGLRRTQSQRDVGGPARPRRGFQVSFNVILAVLALVVIVAVIFGVLSLQGGDFGGATLSGGTVVVNATQLDFTGDEVAQVATIGPTTTTDPNSPTPSPFYGVIVTVNPADRQLPATFTPTASLTPFDTPTPTETPYPIASFQLLYAALDNSTTAGLYTVNGAGADDQQIGQAIDGFDHVAYDPLGERVAFTRQFEITAPLIVTPTEEGSEAIEITPEGPQQIITGSELFVAPAGNIAAAVQITQIGSGTVSHPTWSPDGSMIAYVSDNDGDEEIWAVNADGTNPRQLTNNDGIDKDPAWSPDGRIIVFASDRESPGLTEIYSMNAASGDEVVQLTNDAGSSYSPAWSPAGDRITFISDRNDDGDVFIIDPDGQRPFLLTSDDDEAEDRDPVFSPDSQRVFFLSNRAGSVFQVFSVDLRGNEVVRITDNARDILALDFRPEPFLRLQQ